MGQRSSIIKTGGLTDTPTAEKQAFTTSQFPAIEISGTKDFSLNRISLFSLSYFTLHQEYFPHAKLDKGKGKAVPLQACNGPEGSRKLRFPDFMTTALDDGNVFSLTHRPPLPPGNTPGTHFC
jgi:hypothetical protein